MSKLLVRVLASREETSEGNDEKKGSVPFTPLTDGTTIGGVANVGVRITADPASYPAGSYVAAKGVDSCFSSSGLRPEVLPVSIQTLKAP